MKTTSAVMVAFLLALTHPAAAQDAAAKTANAAAPRIAVEPEMFDFGKAQQEKTLEKEFRVRNLGAADLVIEDVVTTCGCTVAEGYAKVVKPGGSTPLRVKLQTRNTFGKLARSVLVKSNDPSGRPLEIKVEAQVERQQPAS
ncbi:MAG: DUF1573 domain-containing protein [Vicinamibacteria bacterium]